MKFREFTFIPEDKNRPIKVVYEDNDGLVATDDCTIEYTRKLSSMESENLLTDMFGTTDIGVISIDNIKTDYLYWCPTCKKILDLTEIDSCMNTPNEIIDYCLECQSEVVNLKLYKE